MSEIKVHPAAELKRQKAEANNALDLLGAFVGPKLYTAAKETLLFRCEMWLAAGIVAVADIQGACRAIATPSVSAGIEFENELYAVFSKYVTQCRNARIDKERSKAEAEERAKWGPMNAAAVQAEFAKHPELAAELAARRKVREMAEGVGTRVGKDRRSTTPRGTRGEAEGATAQREEEAAQEQAAG